MKAFLRLLALSAAASTLLRRPADPGATANLLMGGQAGSA
jgi:hypothetical protein